MLELENEYMIAEMSSVRVFRVFLSKRDREVDKAPEVYAFGRQGEMGIDCFTRIMDEEGFDVLVVDVVGTRWEGIDMNIMRNYYINDSDYFPVRVRVWIDRVRTLEDVVARLITGRRGTEEEGEGDESKE